ncbi:response regulator transcription factor [Flavobacterium silvaticum]|uniref:Response regulator transcription factor n=1 Tax=Flavobacterium silvaticum TaxID=1852020 RepID=A0A972JKA2_9FLAO|nr:response regulator transcription factor [Flavobacterium silvaticum]NMH28932.1 response regulator transcription factor [Flavobacterium silvaticum]
MIGVCIIEDITDIREGLKAVIEADDRLKLLGCFEDGESALDQIPIIQPEVVITDINLPGKSGVYCVGKLKPEFPSIQFMMFTIYEDNEQVFEALKAGASGYILKNTAPNKIADAVCELFEGGSPMSPTIARKVLGSFNAVPNSNLGNILSPREQEVLELLSKGFLYKEIADRLFISLSTVKRHLNHIYTKLQVQNKTEAVNKLYGKA